MKVTEIRRTVTFGNYENISMSATLDREETVSEALNKLELTIDSEIGRKKSIEQLAHSVEHLTAQKDNLTREIQELSRKKALILKWASKHKVNVSALSELPF